ncbi:MAG: HDOD domain-containing protein [Burkholderiales bacterium]
MSSVLNSPVEAPVAGMRSGAAALARQPILDEKRTVIGYQLFERPRAANNADAVLFDALTDAGSDDLAWRKTVFLRCTFDNITDGHLEMLNPEKVVLEIPGLAAPTALEVTARLELLKRACQAGFRLAFDQSVLQPDYASWLPHASYIKLNLDALPVAALEATVRQARAQSKAQVVADHVGTTDQYESMKKLGIKLFQGNWFARPSPIQDKTVRASQATIIQLLNLVRQEAEVSAIEELLKKDPTLSFKLLRFINSCGFGLRAEITSFRHAVMILGLNQLFRWATLLMTSSMPGGAAPAAGTAAVVRGRLMELLAAELLNKEDCDNAFVAGVFSLVDTLVGMPLATVLDSVDLPEVVANALLNNEGDLAPFLALAKACESGDEATFAKAAGELQLSNHQVNWAHLQALAWADQLQQ